MTDHLQPSRAEATELVADPDDLGPDDADATPAQPTQSPARRRARGLLDWVVVIGVALLVAFLVRTFVLAHFVVDGQSMDTTLHDGDRVFVNKLSYRLHDPNRGDVVVLHQIQDQTPSRDLIKRSSPSRVRRSSYATARCSSTASSSPSRTSTLRSSNSGGCGAEYGPEVVPDDHVFVMGDNRGGSQDSRAIGFIEEDDIVGRAFVVFWPTSHWRWL